MILGVLASHCCETTKQRKGFCMTLWENKTNFAVYLFTDATVEGRSVNLKVSVNQLAPNKWSSVAFKHGIMVT